MSIEIRDDVQYSSPMPVGAWLIGGISSSDAAPTAFSRESVFNYITSALSAVASSGSASDLSAGTLPLARLHSNLSDISSIASPAAGDLLHYNGTAFTVLPAGTNGQVLVSNGANQVPSYQSVPDIPGLDEIARSDLAAGDFYIVRDTSAGGDKKVKVESRARIVVTDYGATGNGSTDDTAAIQAAIDACPAQGTVYFPAGTYSVLGSGSQALLIGATNKSVHLEGDGPGSWIQGHTSLPTTRDVIRIAPTAGTYGWGIKKLRIGGPSFSPICGRHAVHIDTTDAGNAASLNGMLIEQCLITPMANGESIYLNNSVTNLTGGMFYSQIVGNFIESILFAYGGDGITIADNITQGTRAAIWVYQTTGAGGLTVRDNVFTNTGGQVIIDYAIAPKIYGNTFEAIGTYAGPNGAVVNITGSVGSVWRPMIYGNAIQVVPGATGVSSLIRIGTSTNAIIDANRFNIISGDHVVVTSGGTDCQIGLSNQICTNNVVGALAISDAGTRTRYNGLFPQIGGVGGVGSASLPFAGAYFLQDTPVRWASDAGVTRASIEGTTGGAIVMTPTSNAGVYAADSFYPLTTGTYRLGAGVVTWAGLNLKASGDILFSADADYGFRDNAGTMQFKDDGGSWTSFSAGGGGYAPGGTDVAVVDGGTGASSASGARSNLGAAASGANTDITSLTGTTTNDDAGSGKIGEYVSSTILTASGVALTTITPATVTSISLTAGDWDVDFNGYFDGTGLAGFFNVGLHTTSNAFDYTGNGRLVGVGGNGGSLASQFNALVGPCRFSLASTTTIYAVSLCSFSAGTCNAYGTIRARRVR